MVTTIHTRDYADFVRLIKTTRKNAKLTQTQLGRKLKLPQGRISQIERAQRRVDIIELRRICHACGTTLPEFVQKLEAALR